MFMKRTAIAVCLFAAACGDDGGGSPATGSESPAFKDMTFQERYVFMSEVVMPKMRETFVKFDAKFGSMDCTTCHGEGVTDGTFKMPTAQIAMLPDTEAGFLAWVEADPERQRWSDFMFEEVVPQIAELLQVERFDPTTETGTFSCYNCHTLGSVEP